MSTKADTVERAPVRIRFVNALIKRLLLLGVRITPMVLLTVRGRRTGRPRTTPVGLLAHDGHRYLFSAFGEVNWVRNLRAAGVGIIARGRHRETLRAAELSAEEAGQILQSILKSPTFKRVVGPYFPVAPDAPLTAYVHEARRHPVFELGGPAEPTS
jgi:deazaflavin-dependent oxidoreductase (nitroreductase family)